jgi:opacity protein-like surface antigen
MNVEPASRPPGGQKRNERPRPCASLVVTSFVTALLAVVAEPASCAEESPFAEPGGFVRIGLNLGFQNFEWLRDENAHLDANGQAPQPPNGRGFIINEYSTTNFIGFSAAGGYRVTGRIALEAAFDWFRADLYTDASNISSPSEPVRFKLIRDELRVWAATVDTRLYGLKGRFQPYLLVGIGALGTTPVDRHGELERAAGFTSRFGAGIETYVTEWLGVDVGISYFLTTGDTRHSDLAQFGVSVVHHFGR